jgi:hypothetical protein
MTWCCLCWCCSCCWFVVVVGGGGSGNSYGCWSRGWIGHHEGRLSSRWGARREGTEQSPVLGALQTGLRLNTYESNGKAPTRLFLGVMLLSFEPRSGAVGEMKFVIYT